MGAADRGVDADRRSTLFAKSRNTIGARLRHFVAGPAGAIAAPDLPTISGHAGNDGPGGSQNLIGRDGSNDIGVDG
ncbi:hypothetical protein Aph02nite_90080 [Actinoplanes philippinensis]|uniref:hypothetical protein n=1 Tax=Actinoplanes philippinensis TaxID=35752 RepID=UPI0011600EC4|nr:hypothetical protein [Actinoplanes philippinensis]GIE83058.1 hypothetical protein Aph02nite_90080 [Actinoplanes philippinensis]